MWGVGCGVTLLSFRFMIAAFHTIIGVTFWRRMWAQRPLRSDILNRCTSNSIFRDTQLYSTVADSTEFKGVYWVVMKNMLCSHQQNFI
jgi:hypothetical protein